VNEIDKDIAMGGIVTKEQAISRAQYLDLIYSQMRTLYDLLPELCHPNTSSTPTIPAASHAADGVIGTVQAQSHSASSTTPKYASYNVQNSPSPATPTGKTSEVNFVQSTPAGKKKSKNGRGKNKEGKIILKQRKPKLSLLMIGISENHDTLDLSMVMITTQMIFHDMLRSLSSFKELQNPLHQLSCLNPSRLNNSLSWSFMTNPLLLLHHMF
jgi:hypothetical protein